ncbi:DUF481 domain-containing protein [Endozoicomonas sp. 4G]|uniref:DUF481 domain-containing protein n=1 Tax=Endozoicomonas sp. 4G TaxID=2872754 RepID=UPI0020790686|nr:DUF481 domain-containing protein [Endozoicomonas sp. 4G]
MENGDVISGKIKSLEAGKLVLSTRYAGDITVNWRHVRSLETDQPMWVGLIGEKESQQRRLKSNGDQLVVVDPDGYERSFSAAWPVAEILLEQPVLASAWDITGKLNFGLDSDQGVDNETIFTLDGDLNINDEWNKNSFKWDIEIEKEKDSESITKEWELGYAYSRYFTEHWFVQGSLDQEYDSTEDLKSRLTLGGSAGYRFRETINETWITTAGLTHLWENYRLEDNQKNLAVTTGLLYRKKLIDNLEYYFNSKLFYRLSSGREWLFDGEHGLKVGLSENLYLNLMHYLDYDSIPVEGADKTSSQIKFGIGYSW